MVAPRKLFLLALTSLGFTGCAASLQDFHYAAVNKTRAEYAWYSSTSFSDRWNCGSDYAYGYKSGYYDASTGKGCVLPAVPPPCYWSTKYQCCDGQKQIQDWYRGYQCGVAAAQGSGYPSFHDIPIGPQAPVINKDGCGACYSPTGCLCENSPIAPEQSTTDLPQIPHLSASESETEVATHVTAPIHQVSAPIYQASATQPTAASSSAASAPQVVQPGVGLIGPVGPVPKKTSTHRVQVADAEAAAGLMVR